jgi:hypothetical protein
MAAIFISHRSSDNAAATELKQWLADQGHKHFFLDFDPADGIPAGVDWEQTIYHHLRQCQALLIVLTPDWLASKWCFAELALAREQGKAVFVVRTKPVQGGAVIPALQEVDLTEDRDAALAKLARGLKERGLDPRDAFDWHPGRPIYPGLNAFEEEDAAIFFGRSEESWRAVESLNRLRRQGRGAPRLVLIAGASGSGKSSLMRAGIIPRLKKYPGHWLPLRPFRRGVNAVTDVGEALAWAFMQHKGTAAREITAELRAAAARADGEWLRACARELRQPAGSPEATVLIAIDQAEELLAPNVEESASQLLYLLSDALSGADRELMAIATIRSDALGLWQQHPAVRGIEGRAELSFETFPLGPMPLDRTPEIIRRPARYIRLEIDDALVDAVRADVKTTDALPLLAYTLQQLHARSGNVGRLTLPAYDQLGGLEGSIRKIADESIDLQRLSTEDREALRTAFVPTLIRATEAGGFARDRALRERLPRRADPLIQKLVDAHLLITDRDSQGRETVEIAHEALLRTWPTLLSWLVEDRDKLRQHNAIARAAKDWDEGGQKADLLAHRDGRLKDATELVAEKRFAFPPGSVERAYLDACITDQRAREAAEAQAASKLRRREIVAAAAAVAVLVLLVIAAIMWYNARETADIARRARTDSLFRTIGVSSGDIPTRDEREALWELAQLNRADAAVRGTLLNLWFGTADEFMRGAARGGQGFRAAMGLHVEYHRFATSKAAELGRSLALTLADPRVTNSNRLSRCGQTLATLANLMEPSTAAELAKGLAAALTNPQEKYPFRLWGLSKALAGLAGKMEPLAAGEFAKRIAAALMNPQTTDSNHLSSLREALAALADRLEPSAAAALAQSLAAAQAGPQATDSNQQWSLALALAALAHTTSPAAKLAKGPAIAFTSLQFADASWLSKLEALAGKMEPTDAAELGRGLAEALVSPQFTDSNGLSSFEALTALADTMQSPTAAQLAKGLVAALTNPPPSGPRELAAVANKNRLSRLGETLAMLANEMKPQAAGELTKGLAEALANPQLTDSEGLANLGQILAALCKLWPSSHHTHLLALSNMLLEPVAKETDESIEQAHNPQHRTYGAEGWFYHQNHLKLLAEVCAQLRKEDLAEALKFPFCTGEAEGIVLDRLKAITGQDFGRDVWKFAEQADSLGLTNVDGPAKRPSALEALKELDGLKGP